VDFCQVGESEKAIAQLFKDAIDAKPSVIFIDEIEAIFSNKSSSGDFGKKVVRYIMS
jgi:transitional endoplasmic reticulum ATPase